jgi:hypothetical protein
MAHGVSLHLAKIPPHRYYNFQPAMQFDGLSWHPISGTFRPAGAQVAKRERMAARAEKRALRTPKRMKGLRAHSMKGRGQQLPRGERWAAMWDGCYTLADLARDTYDCGNPDCPAGCGGGE